MPKIPVKSRIGINAVIKPGVIVEDNVVIGDNCYIDYGAIIKENVVVGNGCFIGARCILGEFLGDFFKERQNKKHTLFIDDNATIRSETIIYGETKIGKNFNTGHRVTIREYADIGDNVSIGTLSDIQGLCKIGNYTRLHSNVHIGQKSKIGNYVWIFPYVVLTNDPMPPSETLHGVEVDDFAVICTQSTVLPGIRIGQDSFVGVGSIVNKNIDAGALVSGNPAKFIVPIARFRDRSGKIKYPWRYTFDRGMPWEGIGYEDWYNSITENALSAEEK